MTEDLGILARAASKFMESGSFGHIRQLGEDLISAVANAKASSSNDFTWRTAPGSEIGIAASKNWKGNTNNFTPMNAKVGIDYLCTYLPDTNMVLVREGVAVVKVAPADQATGDNKLFHFDAGPGGWLDSAGHPPFHLQFHGMINDIPRVPSVIIHPADVMSFAILELHQSHWRNHVVSFQAKSVLRKFPSRQRRRLQATARRWVETLEAGSGHGLIILQSRANSPLDL